MTEHGRKSTASQQKQERVRALLDDLKRTFLEGTAQRLAAVAAEIVALERDADDRRALERLRQQLHNLAGLSGTHGFSEITAMTRGAEVTCQRLLECGEAPTIDEVQEWRAVHDRMATVFKAALRDRRTVRGPASSPAEPQILIAGMVSRRSDLAAALERCGYSLHRVMTLTEARAIVDDSLPNVVVTDGQLPDGAGSALIEMFRSAGGRSGGAILVTASPSFEEKVEAIRCGADACFEAPVDAEAIVRRIQALVARAQLEAPRILYVEDDRDHAAFAEALLIDAGYTVETCADPATFADRFSAFRPDLVIMDIGLSQEMNGHDLARYIRQDERNATLPIVFLTAAGQLQTRIESVRAGGDDQLLKPVSPSLLLSTIAARLERATLLRSLLERDGLTGLLTHTAFIERAKGAHAEGRRVARSRALVMLDLDHFKGINDRYGHPAGDRVLASLGALLTRRTRRNDSCGRYGGEEFAIMLDDVSCEEAATLVRRLLDEFVSIDHAGPNGEPFRASFSAGVAMLDPASTLDQCVAAADASLYAAKRAGRSRVISASGEVCSTVVPFRRKA